MEVDIKKIGGEIKRKIEKLKSAGVNPLVELGTMPKPAEETPSIPRLGVIAAIALPNFLVKLLYP